MKPRSWADFGRLREKPGEATTEVWSTSLDGDGGLDGYRKKMSLLKKLYIYIYIVAGGTPGRLVVSWGSVVFRVLRCDVDVRCGC